MAIISEQGKLDNPNWRQNQMKIGDHVIYLDEQGCSHDALLTRVSFKEDESTGPVAIENGKVDLMYISQDPAKHEEVLTGKAPTLAGTQKDIGTKDEQAKSTQQHIADKQAKEDAAADKKEAADAAAAKRRAKAPVGQTKAVLEALVDYAYDVPHMPGPGSYGPHWRRRSEQN